MCCDSEENVFLSRDPVLIAEIGVNYYDIAHQRSMEPLEAACIMIEAAAKAGVTGVKFQTYKADNLASRNSPAYWDVSKEPSPSQYDLFKKYDKFGEKEYRRLPNMQKKTG